MKPLLKKDLVRAGYINKISGFNGAVSCYIELDDPESPLSCNYFFLILEGLPVPFKIEKIDLRGNDLIVKFTDVDSEAAAKKILKAEIYTEKLRQKSKKKSLEWTDLKGYLVIDSTEGEIGVIEDILEYPMQFIAKCLKQDKEILFPLNEDIVVDIDDEEKKIIVDLPEGLIAVYTQ
jgi:16S rRNA processing protein RimM